jgi:hypothetical protein
VCSGPPEGSPWQAEGPGFTRGPISKFLGKWIANQWRIPVSDCTRWQHAQRESFDSWGEQWGRTREPSEVLGDGPERHNYD